MSKETKSINLLDCIESFAVHQGANSAIRHKKAKLTYSELPAAIDSVKREASYLAGARVAVILPDSIGTCLLYLHLFVSESTAIPISIQATTQHIANVLARIKPHFVVTNRILYKKHGPLLESFQCVLFDNANTESADFKLIHAGKEAAKQSSLELRQDRAGDDIRVVLFTSGSTGEPKGVCLSDSNLVSAAGMMAEFLNLSPERQTLVTLPLFDYYGFIQIFGHILNGAGCIFGESTAFMGSLFKAIDEDLATDLAVVPYSLRQILDVLDKKPKQIFDKLSFVTSSSDALSATLLERTFALNPDLTLIDIYGLTEAGRACYKMIRKDTPFSSAIGSPSTGVEIVVDGSEEQHGEIVIKGPNVAKGYLRDIVEDRIELIAIDAVKTGDLGYIDDEGNITLVGRKDHIINLMGEKIHPLEIERLATQVDGVEDALAQAQIHADGRKAISLYVVCRSFTEKTKADILELIRKNLPRTFFPEEVLSVPAIQRTELGSKVKRS